MEDLNTPIHIEFKNNDPKENPVTYNIETVQDIADCVTSENIHGFLIDFEACLRANILAKAITDDLIDKKELPEDAKILMPSFTWIDDWKPKEEQQEDGV